MRRPSSQPVSPRSSHAVHILIVIAFLQATLLAQPHGQETTVTAVSDIRPVIALATGRDQGAVLGDRAVVFRAGRPIAAGTLILLGADTCGASLEWIGQPPSSGDATTVLFGRSLRAKRADLPSGTTLHSRISAFNPNRAFAWIDVGRAVGVATEDRWLIWRGPVPIAQGEAVLADDRCTLLELRSIVRDLQPEVGDRVQLSPAPAEQATGRYTGTVLQARPDSDRRQVLVLGHGEPARFHPEDRLDLFRESEYIGYAKVRRTSDLLIEAVTTPELSRESAQVADRAVRRPTPVPTRRSARARLFRVEGSAGLINAGDYDGVTVGDRWVLIDHPEVELLVDAVHAEHCRVVIPTDVSAGAPRLWEDILLGLPAQRMFRLGVVAESLPVDWLATFEIIDDSAQPEPGDLVRIETLPPAAALVVRVENRLATLFCPQAWRVGSIAGAAVSWNRPRSVNVGG